MLRNDQLKELFRERFHGHETPVDAGVWDTIASRLPDALPADDGGESLRELFQERFQGHETHVDPGVWETIGQQLGHGAGVGSGAAGMFGGATGWVAGGMAALLVAGGLYLAMSEPEAKDSEVAVQTTEQRIPEVTIEVTEEAPIPEAEVREAAIVEASIPAETRQAQAATVATSAVPAAASTTQAERTAPATPADAPEVRMAPVQTTVERTQEPPGAALVNAIITDLTQRVAEQPEQLVATPLDRGTRRVQEEEPLDSAWDEEDAAPVTPLTLFMPNVFTPDGDGLNEQYVIQGEGFDHITIKVFSAQNNRLVFSADRLLPWDGTDMQTGQQCPDGYYMVAVEARGLDGRTVPQGKVVWLNRNTMR